MASRTFHSVHIIGIVLLFGTVWINRLSGQFAYNADFSKSPILIVVFLFVAMSLLSLLALWLSVASKNFKVGWKTIVGFAVAMRLVALFSTPILEIDYYRYLWDGETVLAGVSPYDYSPRQVLEVPGDDLSLPEDLQKLTNIRDSVPRNEVILSRIHYGELPSIYPPVSQAVFAIACWTIPDAASVEQAILILKGWIILFDVGVLLLLVRLLFELKMNTGWAIGYGWSPLVIKEFANSGHLDAIALFFSTLAVWCFISAVYTKNQITNEKNYPGIKHLLFSSVALGLAIAAKLYPVILVPLMALTVFRNRGLKLATLYVFVLGIITVVACWPQLGPKLKTQESFARDLSGDSKPIRNEIVGLPDNGPPLPPSVENFEKSPEIKSQNLDKQPEQKSLKIFLTQWKMNDLLFHFVESNLTPNQEHAKPIWFVITPNSLRKKVSNFVSDSGSLDREFVPFLITRTLFALLFFCLAMRWAWRASQVDSPVEWLNAVFLTIAWFWILLPTLNPWYWIWAMPFLAFSQRRAWYLVGVLVLLYYLRFWFQYEWDGIPVWGTPYEGEQFFHHVFVWIEHLPWMLLLLFEIFFSKPLKLWNGLQSDAVDID